MITSAAKRRNSKVKKKIVGKYELGITLGEGTFGKVKHAIHSETKKELAIKILDKEKIRQQNMGQQIKREVSIMKQIGSNNTGNNPHIVQLFEVLASKTRIYLVLELVTGGELFDKIVKETRCTEEKARYYFRQLITGVEFCHNLGVCHRDLKPENLLLDEVDNLKISDFGLSALYTAGPGVSRATLLHTTCGTPNYVAPEVLDDDGYDGRASDIWSIGVILYVMVSGYLPFDDNKLSGLFEKIKRADYKCPGYFSNSIKDLIGKILVPDPHKRATINDIKDHPWYKMSNHNRNVEIRESRSLDVPPKQSSCNRKSMRGLFFTSPMSVNVLNDFVRKHLLEMGFTIDDHQMKSYKIKAEKSTSRGIIGITFQITSSTCGEQRIVEIRRGKGDILLYNNVVEDLVKRRLKSIIENIHV